MSAVCVPPHVQEVDAQCQYGSRQTRCLLHGALDFEQLHASRETSLEPVCPPGSSFVSCVDHTATASARIPPRPILAHAVSSDEPALHTHNQICELASVPGTSAVSPVQAGHCRRCSTGRPESCRRRRPKFCKRSVSRRTTLRSSAPPSRECAERAALRCTLTGRDALTPTLPWRRSATNPPGSNPTGLTRRCPLRLGGWAPSVPMPPHPHLTLPCSRVPNVGSVLFAAASHSAGARRKRLRARSLGLHSHRSERLYPRP